MKRFYQIIRPVWPKDDDVIVQSMIDDDYIQSTDIGTYIYKNRPVTPARMIRLIVNYSFDKYGPQPGRCS